jgi:DNA end-binding protein Ku
MRSMWKGAISFGLVMIPVKLYAATEQKDIAFRQVHRVDGGRIRFRRVCSIDGEEVPYEDVAKGYELPTGEMVVLTDEDLAELPLPTTRSIEVLHFLPEEQLDPILLNRSYFVEPESAGARAYILLRDSLERSGKVALAQVALRQRESLATLRSRDGVLVLETLLWPDEIRAPDFAFLDDDIEVRSQELQMAASLIDSMTVDFDPEEYHDSYREALQELVDAKVEGRDVVQPEVPAEPAELTSLADALKASLAAAQGGSRQAGEVTVAAAPRAIGGSAKKPRPAAKASTTNGARTRGAGTKTAGTKSAGTRGAGTKSAEAKDAGAKDAGTKSARTNSAGTRSAATKSAGTGRTRRGSAGAADGEAAEAAEVTAGATESAGAKGARQPAGAKGATKQAAAEGAAEPAAKRSAAKRPAKGTAASTQSKTRRRAS